ncbi:pimeloyl-ACP methyl ester carboxylesterase [Edaphobacter aggregans]|uniref:Pimeloyl-ACP methyl ester carboxylesterase n=1 Tax=Edaphobacter aggregans TaxID=570835 RepID=A0A428MJE8_9BACT|nr:alpha/beta hydrolase [Edaphobacter aggregans]RSL17002.1 pimeloyl-ACP methyl ester carboxylesterase [Edaphobacter aggregans]
MPQPSSLPRASFHTINADGVQVFYREAGPADAPVILLLHGFPSSSHQYRELIPLLAKRYRVIAPDLPGFGFTVVPDERKYVYTFDSMAKTIDAFLTALGLTKYAIYVFDYGAPVGFRLAVAHPERITAIVSQNGNAYEEGLSDGWGDLRRYWADPTPENRDAIRPMVTYKATRDQYLYGVSDPLLVAPESYTLDAALLARPGIDEIQLDIFLNYATNVALYPTFHQYFRDFKPPLLAIWGKNDPFFIPPGAEAYKRDNPNATVELLDTGHFALETHVEYIAERIDQLLSSVTR